MCKYWELKNEESIGLTDRKHDDLYISKLEDEYYIENEGLTKFKLKYCPECGRNLQNKPFKELKINSPCDFKQGVLMNRELIKNYVNYLNKAINMEEDPNEAYILEGQRDDLLDILEENNVYRAIEDLGSFCPDEKIVGTYECVGLHDGFSCFCCEQCWKNILGI